MTPSSLAIAYLDPTALIPVVFGEEPVGAVTQVRLNRFPILVSSNLLEAELRVEFELQRKSSTPTGYQVSSGFSRETALALKWREYRRLSVCLRFFCGTLPTQCI